MKNLPILLKRETWEHNSFWVVPTVMMGIIILGALGGIIQGVGGTIGFNNFVHALEMAPENGRRGVIFAMFISIATMFFVVMTFVIFFYLLDALFSERKERHILFWKSMPVSDTETVVSKVITASLVIPGFFFVGILLTKAVFLILSTIFVWIGGGSASELIWSPAPFFADIGVTIYYIIASGLWMLPFTGWLLLSSSLAKKARPFMWAVLVPVFLIMFEQIVFGSLNIVETIGSYLTSFYDDAFVETGTNFSINFNDGNELATEGFEEGFSLNEIINPVGLLTSGKFWIGQIVGIIFITAAIYIRRFRDDS